jgi:hypothetical protein
VVEAFAKAVAAKLAGSDAGVARRTEEFLVDQSALLKAIQKRRGDDPATGDRSGEAGGDLERIDNDVT